MNTTRPVKSRIKTTFSLPLNTYYIPTILRREGRWREEVMKSDITWSKVCEKQGVCAAAVQQGGYVQANKLLAGICPGRWWSLAHTSLTWASPFMGKTSTVWQGTWVSQDQDWSKNKNWNFTGQFVGNCCPNLTGKLGSNTWHSKMGKFWHTSQRKGVWRLVSHPDSVKY